MKRETDGSALGMTTALSSQALAYIYLARRGPTRGTRGKSDTDTPFLKTATY